MKTTLDRFQTFTNNTKRRVFYKSIIEAFAAEVIGLGKRSDLAAGIGFDLLARHHGLPSVLLDWTKSPYVAAYFAFEHALLNPSVENCAIWTLNRARLSDTFTNEDLITDRELLWANPRALGQFAVFLYLAEAIPSAEEQLGTALIKYELPAEECRITLRDLEGMAITARNLFRDFDSAAKTAKMSFLI